MAQLVDPIEAGAPYHKILYLVKAISSSGTMDSSFEDQLRRKQTSASFGTKSRDLNWWRKDTDASPHENMESHWPGLDAVGGALNAGGSRSA